MSKFHLAICALLLGAALANADELIFDSADEWATWQQPFGLTKVDERGQLQLVKFRKDINAMQDAHLFLHETKERGDAVPGGIWEAGSNPQTAALAIDGDPQTFWQPDADAALEDWFLTVDLGRAVLARQIRLTFPDQEGARPLRQFTVLVNTGVRIVATQDVFLYRSVYRTTRPNEETSIVIDLGFPANDSTLVIDGDLRLDADRRDHYQLIQYVNIMAEEQNPDGALAEIEIVGIGDNIAIDTDKRGSISDGFNATGTANLFDANLNTNNLISSGIGQLGWKEGGVFFGVDLGAVFFVDELFLYSMRQQEGTLGFGVGSTGPGHTILFSDGTRTLGSGLPVAESFDFTELLTHLEPGADRLFYIRYLFKPRRMRYLFWHGVTDQGWGRAKWGELMIFSPGYPAQVTLRSDFIDLGGQAGDDRPKIINALKWDAELPAGTTLRIRSRSGNQLQGVYTFFDRSGVPVTEEKWKSAPKVLRGPVDTSLVVGEDWGAWSEEYRLSPEAFKSESPRRYVQLEMALETEDPAYAPAINALSIEFEKALVQEALGRIEPRQAAPNETTRFTYALSTRALSEDSGFDRLRFTLPSIIDMDAGIEVHTAGAIVEPLSIKTDNDSLFIELPQAITSDSLEIRFSTRVLQSAALFSLDLGARQSPGLWQSVEAATRRSNIVLLPELATSRQLIDDLHISPSLFTPNGDGINDQVEISFVALKMDTPEPQVRIFDLSGRLITQLVSTASDDLRSFVWDGTGGKGDTVAPGIYLCRINLGAQTGEDRALRLIRVAY